MKKTTPTNDNKPTAKQHILVAVTGNTPQIVTETLYVLAVAQQPPIPISEVYILTTAKGAEIAWAKLGGTDGAIAALQREYEIGGEIVFNKENILVFKRRYADGSETPLDDIRSSADNETLASELLGFIKALTIDPNVVLHCSLGGGRRTMSAYMMLALMMYGRAEDELTHVVVTEEFETNSDFFFPPKQNQPLPIRVAGNKLAIINTSEAKLEVAQIPFVRLRNTLGEDVGKVEHGLQELITIAQQRLDRTAPQRLVIELAGQRVRFGARAVTVRGVRLALLAYYADVKLNRCVQPNLPVCGACQECFTTPALTVENFQQFYKRLYVGVDSADAPASRLDTNSLLSYHTKLNQTLRPLSAKINARRKWGETTYGLNLDKNLLEIL
ncbi:MAG: TIGR02584 family CRISPR-associated protein [Acidobacteria bacterium]|nr:TIGR02584 family CRISPR-associated protein [Acidobacteriota bacterium]MBI3424090.1 TIGR02584 family CRISPR-associated protein [Acidobacteriota bacterium]